jgi:hypothetical protein
VTREAPLEIEQRFVEEGAGRSGRDACMQAVLHPSGTLQVRYRAPVRLFRLACALLEARCGRVLGERPKQASTMNLKTLIRQLDDAGISEGVLHAIGLESRRNIINRTLAGIALFSAGALLGAGIGFVLAPMSGEELRAQAADRVGTVRQRVMRRGRQAVDDVRSTVREREDIT